MEDLIKRSDAIRQMSLMLEDISEDLSEQIMQRFGYDTAEELATEAMSIIPSADRPQGKWKAKSFHEFFCNNCGFSFDMMKCEFLENMKYCPNCGVRKGADDE